MISLERRYVVASRSAASFASEPLPTKKTFLSPEMGASSMSFSASLTCFSIRYRVEEWKILSACSFTAPATSGIACPLMVVTIPPKKSRYSLPSESHTRKPSPRTSSIGLS